MAKTKTKLSAAEMLKKVSGKASKDTAKPKEEERWTIFPSEDIEKDVYDFVRVGTVLKELDPLAKQRKSEVELELFDIWIDRFWQDKKVPQNPRVVIYKRDEKGQKTAMEDVDLLMQVKCLRNGIAKAVPSAENLPEGKTLQEVMQMMLTSPKVGLSEENAALFLHPENGEVLVEDQVYLVDSLDTMLNSDNDIISSAAHKLLTYLSAEGNKEVKVEPLTGEESSQILKTQQVVSLKDGFYERACMYCKTKEQLRELILFTRPSFSLGSLHFAISDKKPERVKRLGETVVEFVGKE